MLHCADSTGPTLLGLQLMSTISLEMRVSEEGSHARFVTRRAVMLEPRRRTASRFATPPHLMLVALAAKLARPLSGYKLHLHSFIYCFS